MRKTLPLIPAVMIAASFILLLCLLFADRGSARYKQQAALDYQKEHSLFENILFTGEAYAGAYKNQNESNGNNSNSNNSNGNNSNSNNSEGNNIGTENGEKAEDEDERSAVQIPEAQQQIRLIKRREGKWSLYLPADLAGKVRLNFDHFAVLELNSLRKESQKTEAAEESSEDGEQSVNSEQTVNSEQSVGEECDSKENSFILRSGDIFRCSRLENGSLWQARLLDKDGVVLEEAELVFYSAHADVPTLYINTETGGLDAVNADKSVREECRYAFFTESGQKDAAGRCTIHGRGNSSWKEDKKQYSLNLASSRKVFGMEQARKFALIANTSDDSYLRNKTVFDLSEQLKMAAAPQSSFVNVYFNGSYHGLYLLAQRPNAKGGSVRIADLEKENEKLAGKKTGQGQGQYSQEDIEQNSRKNNNDIDSNSNSNNVSNSNNDSNTNSDNNSNSNNNSNSGGNADDSVHIVTETDENGLELHASPQKKVPANISGGYLLEIDGRYEDEDYWFSTQTHHFVVKSPEAVPLKEGQYIAGYLREAEKALFDKNGKNADTGKNWDDYLDMESWMKMYVMQDFMVQWDVESFSFFVYKDANDPLLYCGPVWDFDLSMGATGLGRLPNVMMYSDWLRGHREGWLTELDKFPAFTETLRTFAREEFMPALQNYLDGEFRDQMETLAPSAAMDAHRWGETDSFSQSAQNLLSWLEGRAAFWESFREDPAAFCTVTLRYGFNDMEIFIPRGEPVGFVPVEEYGEHLYSSFRKKYGNIDGWTCEDGSRLTPETVIDHDQILTPFAE